MLVRVVCQALKHFHFIFAMWKNAQLWGRNWVNTVRFRQKFRPELSHQNNFYSSMKLAETLLDKKVRILCHYEA